MDESPTTSTRRTLRIMQIAAFGALILIGAIVFTFTRVPSKTNLPPLNSSTSYRQKLPHFEWQGPSGESLSSDDLLDGWTLISFWSMTCLPCLQELPAIDQLADDWTGPELSIVAVNVDPADPDTDTAIERFLTDNDVQLPMLRDRKAELKAIFDVHEIPRHFLVNPKGEVVWQALGSFDWKAPESTKTLITLMEKDNVSK